MMQEYREHIWRNGHAAVISIFDNLSPANQDKYNPPVEAPVPASPIDDGAGPAGNKEPPEAAEVCRLHCQDER